jgi:DNA ligase D-like protein (predicted ligase)
MTDPWLERKIPPMLSTSGRAFDSPEHLFEVKWDGIRMLAFVGPNKVRLQNRKLSEEANRYPDLVAVLSQLSGTAVLDGEVVVFEKGKPSFERVLERELASAPELIRTRSRTVPATYVAFDLLYRDGEDLLKTPLRERKRILRELLAGKTCDALLESPFVLEKGREYYERAAAEGLEGIVAKALASPYLPGKRSRYWIKAKVERTMDCLVLGTLVEPGTGRVRSLVLGAYRDHTLIWMGNVGSGLDARTLKELETELAPLAGERPAGLTVAGAGDVRWLKPALVARVKYLETTGQGRLRAPVFQGFVNRSPESCTVP